MTELERLERALAVVAYVVVKHGAVYAPILERELETARTSAPVERARNLLQRYIEDGGRIAAAPTKCDRAMIARKVQDRPISEMAKSSDGGRVTYPVPSRRLDLSS